MIGFALIYITWYLFVLAMCVTFSPWFVFLLLITPRFKGSHEKNNGESDDGESETSDGDNLSQWKK